MRLNVGDTLETSGFSISNFWDFFDKEGIDIYAKKTFSYGGKKFKTREFNELDVPNIFSEVLIIKRIK